MAKQAQAICIHNYGGPEELKLEQVQVPDPQTDEVLVRVRAVGVNPVDWKITEGWLKDVLSIQFPYIPGRDIAGIVEEVGPGVTAFQKGQAVFGQSAKGGYAEYTPASINTLALKPDAISFEEAATIPVGATTAWQGLFDHGNLQPGQTVLIQGASGGVGLFAVQFAHWKGARVIGTTSSASVDFVRSLGADTVIDYTSTSVEQAVHDVDLVFDTVGGPTLASSLKALKNGGTLVTIAGQPEEAQVREKNARVEWFSAQVSHDLLATFAKLIEEGQLKVVIEATYPLAEAAQAHQRSKTGHGRGRIVLKVAD
ncbi:NADP-dependent oxidoreductase [Dictyobacter formicarum]|uniref:NADPH:quinone reductase n=1 Tax=Dictyobacter formicarum TaxID=2778368 RepID=A0ABQ3VQB5_9CHLR|nr:NADP-dependent oxidoreductase [Dictyobacter formicarum]GHO88457.1 NADPH:quinone reductase [Dictyobacter formicarum]